ncbi:hypothetical protein Ae201684P_009901 [Aphanomyces euteiches]|nr:hypothetical protein Ae201684P_009901 [Aphanomyces euteiches]
MSAQFLKAAGKRDIERAETLLDHIHFQNKKGESGLHLAIAEDELAMVEFLCNHGANVNLKEKKSGYTTIMLALAQQPSHYVAMLEILLKHQPDLTLKDSSGQTALHLAARTQNLQSISLPYIPDAKNMTPLLVASARGNADIVSLLVNKGHGPNSVDANGNSALHWACMQTRSDALEIVQALCAKGAKSSANKVGYTPLHAEALRADPSKPWPTEVAQFLLEKFPESAKIKNAQGKTAAELLGGVEETPVESAPAKKNTRGKKVVDDDGPNETAIQNARNAMMARAKEKAAKRRSLIPEEDNEPVPVAEEDTAPVVNNTSGLTMALVIAVIVAFFAAVYALLDASTKK